jgi:hypothetical protein
MANCSVAIPVDCIRKFQVEVELFNGGCCNSRIFDAVVAKPYISGRFCENATMRTTTSNKSTSNGNFRMKLIEIVSLQLVLLYTQVSASQL